jgi:hypothetical protein
VLLPPLRCNIHAEEAPRSKSSGFAFNSAASAVIRATGVARWRQITGSGRIEIGNFALRVPQLPIALLGNDAADTRRR